MTPDDNTPDEFLTCLYIRNLIRAIGHVTQYLDTENDPKYKEQLDELVQDLNNILEGDYE